ncbi:MAG: agmatinase [Proteobacteria bacterium]|nr:agmatinase [Pseudomonadota bacterium]
MTNKKKLSLKTSKKTLGSIATKSQKKLFNSFDFVAQKNGFLGIEESYLNSPQDAKVVVVPFGLEKSVSYGGGTKNGPQAIITKIDYNSVAKSLDQLENITEALIDADKFPLILGGEHSITAGSIRPFVKKYPDLAILHFDAHADLRDGYDGEHFSHASALRRVMDHPISTLISCGIRNISASEIPYLENNSKRITIHFAKDKHEWDYKKIVAPLKGRNVFLTFDIDGFDSGIMQATGTPEPGGLLWYDAINIIKEASKICNFVGADVVELAPVKSLHSCDFLTAKLCYKILSFALAKPKKKF